MILNLIVLLVIGIIVYIFYLAFSTKKSPPLKSELIRLRDIYVTASKFTDAVSFDNFIMASGIYAGLCLAVLNNLPREYHTNTIDAIQREGEQFRQTPTDSSYFWTCPNRSFIILSDCINETITPRINFLNYLISII